MEIMRPTRQIIRRTFTPGVSLEYSASPNEMSFFAKINSVQVREKGKNVAKKKTKSVQGRSWISKVINQICGSHQQGIRRNCRDTRSQLLALF